jgi:hypothetical protein
MESMKEIARILVENLEKSVKSEPTELILNMAEVGSQEWRDDKPRPIISS